MTTEKAHFLMISDIHNQVIKSFDAYSRNVKKLYIKISSLRLPIPVPQARLSNRLLRSIDTNIHRAEKTEGQLPIVTLGQSERRL